MEVIYNKILTAIFPCLCAVGLYSTLDYPTANKAPEVTSVDSSDGGVGDSISQSTILSANLMGQHIPEKVQKPKSIPVTRLNLTLSGVFAGQTKDAGAALIADTQRRSAMYQVGERLPSGAMLAEVYADHVVLDRYGNLEKLYLPNSQKSVVSNMQDLHGERGVSDSSQEGAASGTVANPVGEQSLKNRLQALRQRHQ